MALHRYWRIQAKSVQSGTVFALAEVQMRIVAAGADQCVGGVAAASSVFSGSVAANAFDDNLATWWGTLSGSQVDGWIGYDFGAGVTKEIVEVVLTARNDTSFAQAPSLFHVAGSDDAVTWIDYKRHTSTAWTTGSSQTFAVPLTPAPGLLQVGAVGLDVLLSGTSNVRVGAANLQVLLTYPSKSRVGAVSLQVLRTVNDGAAVIAARRRQMVNQ